MLDKQKVSKCPNFYLSQLGIIICNRKIFLHKDQLAIKGPDLGYSDFYSTSCGDFLLFLTFWMQRGP